jgi:hypothetical protein
LIIRGTTGIYQKNLLKRLDASDRSANESSDKQQQALREIEAKLDSNEHLITEGNSLIGTLVERFNWIQQLGSDMKTQIVSVVRENIAIYRELVALRTAFQTTVDRSIFEDYFVMEDAIGRIAPIHVRLIANWAQFDAVMLARFEGHQGRAKILRKEYRLQENDETGKEIDRSLKLHEAIVPKQHIVMTAMFKGIGKPASDTHTFGYCPRCNTKTDQPDQKPICW